MNEYPWGVESLKSIESIRRSLHPDIKANVEGDMVVYGIARVGRGECFVCHEEAHNLWKPNVKTGIPIAICTKCRRENDMVMCSYPDCVALQEERPNLKRPRGKRAKTIRRRRATLIFKYQPFCTPCSQFYKRLNKGTPRQAGGEGGECGYDELVFMRESNGNDDEWFQRLDSEMKEDEETTKKQ
jgi:hypothetical protein